MGSPIYVAAQADVEEWELVQLYDPTGEPTGEPVYMPINEETGWGAGTEFNANDKKNWAEYFACVYVTE